MLFRSAGDPFLQMRRRRIEVATRSLPFRTERRGGEAEEQQPAAWGEDDGGREEQEWEGGGEDWRKESERGLGEGFTVRSRCLPSAAKRNGDAGDVLRVGPGR